MDGVSVVSVTRTGFAVIVTAPLVAPGLLPPAVLPTTVKVVLPGASPVSTHEVSVVMHGAPPVLAVTEYVTGEVPPSSEGAVHETVACSVLGVATTPVTEPGATAATAIEIDAVAEPAVAPLPDTM